MPPDISKAAPGFDDPLEMLAQCHDRIRSQCRTLSRLMRYLPSHGADAAAQRAAAAVIRYFDSAGRQHHEDEEQDLFPLLAEAGESRLPAALSAEHREMERLWQELRPALEEAARGRTVRLAATRVERFTTLYARHTSFEEAELLPLAARILTDASRRRLGRSMAARRGVAADGERT